MPRFVELIGAGVEALQRRDPDALWDLTREAETAEAPGTASEQRAAADQLLIFRQLLRLTRHNLLLVRAACRQTDSYRELGN